MMQQVIEIIEQPGTSSNFRIFRPPRLHNIFVIKMKKYTKTTYSDFERESLFCDVVPNKMALDGLFGLFQSLYSIISSTCAIF